MCAFWIGVLCGAPMGAALLAALVGLLRRRVARAPLNNERSESDRELVLASVAAYALGMREEVSQFTDRLAGDDLVLREHLRRFEGGGAR